MARTLKPCPKNATFELWMKFVDAHLLQKCGMTSDCLPDFCYRDAYDNGATPSGTASRAYRNARECF